MYRVCSACKEEKPLNPNHFHRRSDGQKGGYFSSCKPCENLRSRVKYHKYIERERARGRAKNQANKRLVMKYYGDKCACCGESERAFLSIDHIDNSGAYHRKNKTQGASLYVWLKRNAFPQGFQILCYNCNWAKSRAGGCPHQLAKQ